MSPPWANAPAFPTCGMRRVTAAGSDTWREIPHRGTHLEPTGLAPVTPCDRNAACRPPERIETASIGVLLDRHLKGVRGHDYRHCAASDELGNTLGRYVDPRSRQGAAVHLWTPWARRLAALRTRSNVAALY